MSAAKAFCCFLEYGEDNCLTKNQVGLLLVKLCFESLPEDTLTLEQLNGQLQIHLKEIRNEKVKHFKDISGFPLNEFLTVNKDSYVFKSKKGRRYVKLKSSRKSKRSKVKLFSDSSETETENDDTLLKKLPDTPEKTESESSEAWTVVKKGKRKVKQVENQCDSVVCTEEKSYAKVLANGHSKQDFDVEKFKSLIIAPVDRDHKCISDVDIYKKNKLSFMVDVVSMWNTPQRTNAYIVLGVEKGKKLPHTLIGMQENYTDDFFQGLFKEGHFTMRPKFKYHEIQYEGGKFGFIEIESSHGYGLPCIVKTDAQDGKTMVKENDLWFRQGVANTVCKPTDPTFASVYHWFAKLETAPMLKGAASHFEAQPKKTKTWTTETEDSRDLEDGSTSRSFDQFWRHVQSFRKSRFVLISADVQNRHRHLSALSSVPWIAVYDFDINSTSDGLLNAMQDSIERKRSLHLVTWCESQNALNLSEQATCWCSMRGRREIPGSRTDKKMGETEDARDWFIQTKGGVKAVCEQLETFSDNGLINITLVLIWPDDDSLVPILQRFVGHLNESLPVEPRIVIILAKESKTESGKRRFEVFCEDYKSNIVVCKIEIEDVCVGIMQKMKTQNPAKLNLSLPTADGNDDLSLTEKDAAWLKEDLDVLYIDNPFAIGETDEAEVQEAIDAFYRGVPLHWHIRYECAPGQIDIERDKMISLQEALETHLKNFKTVVITLYHSPGSGGTTLAQSILWKFHSKYPCVHLKLRSVSNTDELIRRVYFINKKTQLPVVMLIDGEEESKVMYLSKRLQYTIIIYVKRYPYKIQNDVNGSKLFLEGCVSPAEAAKLSAKFGENCDDKKKRELEKLSQDVQTKKQEHHLYEFGLTRYHHEFHGIVSFVEGYLQLDQNPSEQLLPWQRCLGYLALIYFYGQASVPCQFFAKLMNKAPNYNMSLEDFPHQFSQFVTFDTNQGKKDYIRICHYLVAKEILEQILSRHYHGKYMRTDCLGIVASRNLSKFCIEFIEYAGGRKTRSVTQMSTVKFILTKTFIFREDSQEFDTEDQKRKRPLLSKLLMDIPSDQPLFTERLNVLEKLTSSFPNDPNFLAHLGRFYAFCRPNDEKLAEKYSKKAVDLCQKQIGGSTIDRVNDSTRLTLMHVFHMYAYIKRKAISRYTGWSEKDKAPVRTKTDQFEERLEELISLAETACSYYKKSREATPETHSAFFCAYTDEIKVRLQLCEFVRKQQRKRSGSDEIASFFESDASKPAKAFISRSIPVIENLIMECYMDFELLNEESQSLQHLVMWYNSLFKEKVITLDALTQQDDDDISSRCLQIALIKLKYGTKSTFGNIQNIDDKDDVNAIVCLLEEIFDRTEKYGFTSSYGKHELERDFRDWIYAIRHEGFQNDYTVERVLSTLQLWQDRTNSPLSRYYIFIMKSLIGFGSENESGKTECLVEAETAKEDLMKMKRLIIRPKYPREWLGRHGNSIRRLLSGKRYIGNATLSCDSEAPSFHTHPSVLAVCKGTILAPNTNRIGSYIAYDLGVTTAKVFFLPKYANLEGSRYVGHRVEFNLAFSIEHGYEAYHVALLKYYGCPNCSARLEFTSEMSVEYCKCRTPVYKDDMNESRVVITDS